LKELVDEDLEASNALAHSNAYTINDEPGDFCPCSKGMSLAFDLADQFHIVSPNNVTTKNLDFSNLALVTCKRVLHVTKV
jgi:hypothetical protein